MRAHTGRGQRARAPRKKAASERRDHAGTRRRCRTCSDGRRASIPCAAAGLSPHPLPARAHGPAPAARSMGAARARSGRLSPPSRALLVAAAVLAAGSPHAASRPEAGALPSPAAARVPPPRACHLGMCLRRGPRGCAAPAGTEERAGTAGARIEHSLLPGDQFLGQLRAGATESAASVLPTAAAVAELIPDDESGALSPRYSTHLHVLDDQGTLRVSLVVLDPGRYQLVHGLAESGGLTGSYFGNTALQGEPELTRVDSTVDFDWGSGAVAGLSGLDYAGARWCGYIGVEDVPMARKLANGDRYVLWLDLGAATDGARLWLNGTMLIDAWDRGHERLPSANVQLRPGTLNSITLEYKHATGHAAVRLLWSSAWATLQPIPARNLFSVRAVGAPVLLRVDHGRLFEGSLYVGQGLSTLTAGAAEPFQMSAKDAYGNTGQSLQGGKLILSTTPDVRAAWGTQTNATNTSVCNVAPGVEASSGFAGKFEGLLHLTRAGTYQIEAFYGAAGALSATYYITHDEDTFLPLQTGLWQGPITSTLPSQATSASLVFREGYAVRWAGFVRIPNATDFAFYPKVESTRERIKLWVDDRLVINQWTSLETLQPSVTFTPATAGALYRVMLEYHDGLISMSNELSSTGVSLEWESPSGSGTLTPREMIPQASLFSAMRLAGQTLTVQAARAHPKSSSLQSSPLATAGSAHSFHVVVRDEFGNAAPTSLYTDDNDNAMQCDSHVLEALVDQSGIQVEATFDRHTLCASCAMPEGYSGRATPLISGLGSLWALLGGFHIQGSPMHLDVNPGTVVASRSVAQGSGLSISTAGERAQFTIFAKDEHGNLARPNPPGSFGVAIYLTESQTGSARYAGIDYQKARAGVDRYPLDMGPHDLVPQQQDASTWKLDFVLTRSGAYVVNIKWAGEHVSGSPFSCIVNYGSTCAASSYVSGSGLSISTAGKPASFSIFARDTYHNVLVNQVSSSGPYFVPILYSPGSGLRPLHLGIRADDNAVHPVQFSTTRGGTHSLEVSLASAGGLAATYFSEPSLAPASAKESHASGKVVDWSSRDSTYVPAWNSGANAQQYGARWSGLLKVASMSAPTYTFFSALRTVSERIKLWIDTSLVVDQWTSLASTLKSGSLRFVSSPGLYDIKIEYRDSQQFNTTQRGLQVEMERGDVRLKLTTSDLYTIIPITSPLSHRTYSATAVALQSFVYGSGLTVLTAGVSSELTIVAKDTFGNVIDSHVEWIQKNAGATRPYSNGEKLSISTTLSGNYQFEVKLLQVGGLQATFYSDATLSRPTVSGPMLSDLGFLESAPLGAAIAAKPSYHSVRWTGYLNLPYEGDYTFFADNSVANRLVLNGTEVFDHIPNTASSSFGFVSFNRSSQSSVFGLPITYEMRHASGVRSPVDVLKLTFTTGNVSSKNPISGTFLTYENPVGNSPFTAAVQPARVCASRSVPYGSGMTVVTAGRIAIFFIQSKDEFANDIQTQYTTCTTSGTCESGTTLGYMAFFRPVGPGTQSRRVISSYNSGGEWDMLVLAVTISGNYFTDISLAYVGGLDAAYHPSSGALDAGTSSSMAVQQKTGIFLNHSALPAGVNSSSNGLSVRWTGFISIPCLTEDSCSESAKERFAFKAEMTPLDRVKLWLDNRLIIDEWSSLSGVSPTGTVGLDESGRLWNIVTEYKHETNGTGTFRLMWKLNAGVGTYTVIPSANLHTSAPVRSSPYQSRVWPAAVSGDYLSISALSVATAGVSSYFTVTAKDSFNSNRDFGDLFVFKTQKQGSNSPWFMPTIENGTTTDGLFYATGTSELLQTEVSEYETTLFFLNLGGLMATYYDSSNFINPKRASVVKKVDLCPTTGCGTRPTSSNLDDNTPFSVRFDGAIKPVLQTGYKIKVTVKDPSDRVRVWFDNSLIIDQWNSLAAITAEADVGMTLAGAHYELTIMYKHVQVGIGYGCRLEWKASSDASFALIPSTRLYQSYSSQVQTFNILPSSTCTPTSTATGVGLTLATAGLRSVFTISARDEYGNARNRDSSRFVSCVQNSGHCLLSEASALGVFKAVQVSSKSEQNLVSVASIRQGGLTQEYYDNSHFQGSASISVDTEGPVDFSWSQHILPWRTATSSSIQWSGFLRPIARTGFGLMATYYNDTSNLKEAVQAVGESGAGSIDFSQTSRKGTSIPDAALYSVRWAGFLQPTYTQTYTFHSRLLSDQDRVKLWIDNTLVIDQWASLAGNRTRSTAVSLTEDKFHSVTLEYGHFGPSNTSGISLMWSASGLHPKILSQDFLFPKNYSTERVEFQFYVSNTHSAVLKVGKDTIINSSVSLRDAAGRFTGKVVLETGILYELRIQYPNAPTSGSVLLEWATPNNPVPHIIHSRYLYSQSSPSDYISGSPFEIFVLPADPVASLSSVEMLSPLTLSAGTRAHFQLTAFDATRNQVFTIQEPAVFLLVLRHASKSYYSFYTTKQVSMSQRHQTVAFANRSDGTFEGSITTTCAGKHTIDAWLALPGGLSATYYSDSEMSERAAQDSRMSNGALDWSSSSLNGPANYVAARWRGFLRAESSGAYSIKAGLHTTDARVKLWIDNVLLIDAWETVSSQNLISTISLTHINYVEIVLEYKTTPGAQNHGLSLQWKASGPNFQVIPSHALFSSHQVDPAKTPFEPTFLPLKPEVSFVCIVSSSVYSLCTVTLFERA